MKKLISAILALFLCVMSFAFAEALDVTGDWYLNAVESEGMQFDPELMGMELVITLNADGSAEMRSFGENDSCSWRMDGNNVVITDASGSNLIARPENGNLEIDDVQNGMVQILGREEAEAQNYVSAPVVSEPSVQDFVGSWKAVFVDMMGMQLSVEVLDMKQMLEITPDRAIVIHADREDDFVYAAPLNLNGSVLTIDAVDDQMPINLQLLQDGKLVYSEETDGLVMTIYFEKIV